jgi:transposase InsO family protein
MMPITPLPTVARPKKQPYAVRRTLSCRAGVALCSSYGSWHRLASGIDAAAEIEVLRTPVRAPSANAYAERWVGTVRREVRDRTLIFGGRQLRSVLAEYAHHYDVHRPHRALGQAPPLGSAEPPVIPLAGGVARRVRLGRLIYEYAQVA